MAKRKINNELSIEELQKQIVYLKMSVQVQEEAFKAAKLLLDHREGKIKDLEEKLKEARPRKHKSEYLFVTTKELKELSLIHLN